MVDNNKIIEIKLNYFHMKMFLGAHLHDGSEYTGSYEKRVSPAAIKKWHRVRIDACIDGGVDGLAIETIPCLVRFNFFQLFFFRCTKIYFTQKS